MVTIRRNRQWLVANRVDGEVSSSNFRWNEAAVPPLEQGQFLLHNLWLSFDPTQIFMIARGASEASDDGRLPLGSVMSCIAVSEVVESRSPRFSPGDLVHGHAGWEDFTVTDGDAFTPTYRVPPGISPHWAVGALGLTGLVAYFGVTEIARPAAGETFVISGAAGGVGTIACQLAKLRGMHVVGIVGSAAKGAWLLREAGIDSVIDYRREDVGKRLTEICPGGIDVFFDNDGGGVLDLALERLRPGGRVVLCGATSRYAARSPPAGPANYLNLIMVNGRMEGLLGRDFIPRRQEAFDAMLPLLTSGRLKSKEDVVDGLRSAPEGMARQFRGENVGKQVLRMDAPLGASG